MHARRRGLEHGFTGVRAAGPAVAAGAAGRVPADGDVVADPGRGNAGADGLDNTGAFVAENDGRCARVVHIAEVRVADAGGHDADADFAGSGIVHRHRFEPGQLPQPVQDKGPRLNRHWCRRRRA